MLSTHSRDSKQAHDVVGRPAMLPVQGSRHPTPVQESRGNLAFSFKHQDGPWDSISEIRWKGILYSRTWKLSETVASRGVANSAPAHGAGGHLRATPRCHLRSGAPSQLYATTVPACSWDRVVLWPSPALSSLGSWSASEGSWPFSQRI